MQRKRRRLEGRERERRRGRGGSRGRSGVGGGNGLWRKAEGDAFIIRIAGLFWSPEPFRLFEICSVEGEKERGGIGSYEDVKDGERNSEGKRRRRSLRLAKETREVWMVFEECHVIIGPPFERPFQREAAPPLGSARLASAVPFLWVVAFPSTRVQFAQPYDQWTINFLSLVRTLFLKNCDFHRSSSYLYFKSFKFFN